MPAKKIKRQYKFRPGGAQGFRNANKSDPQVIGETLESIRTAHNGRLQTPDVVDAARPESSPINSNFTWSDTEAGHLYRLEEARHLVRSYVEVTVSPSTGEQTERVVNVSIIDDDGERSYRDVREIDAKPDLRASVLELAVADLRKWRRAWNGQIDQDILDMVDDVIKFAGERAEELAPVEA